jgi:hypothetical protein
MAQALEKAAQAELGDIAAELEQKSARLQALLAPEAIPGLSRAQLHGILRSAFATRRKASRLLEIVGEEKLRAHFAQLLYHPGALRERFQDFVNDLSGYRGCVLVTPKGYTQAELAGHLWCDLASELLHFTRPDDCWLWTRWMWGPEAGTGAVPLVVENEYDLHGRDAGETYLKVGVAVAFVRATGEAAGFARFGAHNSPFNVDVFLACVYAVYMYTTLRLRMTQEFNKVVPQLPELTRRLLGVWKMEV